MLASLRIALVFISASACSAGTDNCDSHSDSNVECTVPDATSVLQTSMEKTSNMNAEGLESPLHQARQEIQMLQEQAKQEILTLKQAKQENQMLQAKILTLIQELKQSRTSSAKYDCDTWRVQCANEATCDGFTGQCPTGKYNPGSSKVCPGATCDEIGCCEMRYDDYSLEFCPGFLVSGPSNRVWPSLGKAATGYECLKLCGQSCSAVEFWENDKSCYECLDYSLRQEFIGSDYSTSWMSLDRPHVLVKATGVYVNNCHCDGCGGEKQGRYKEYASIKYGDSGANVACVNQCKNDAQCKRVFLKADGCYLYKKGAKELSDSGNTNKNEFCWAHTGCDFGATLSETCDQSR